jgi:acyl carrier protein
MSAKIERVKNWIVDRNESVTDISADVDLIETRLVDSLSFTELIMLIQQLSGEMIDQSKLDIEDYRTLGAIERRYFSVTTVG